MFNLAPNNKVTYELRDITPADAKTMLERVYKDRGRIEDAIQRYAQAMASDGWVLNGMPIILDPEGRVLDGVQRLHACVDSDSTFRTLVAKNVSADTLHTLDQHRRRTYRQVIEARGLSGYVFPALTKLIRIEQGVLGISTAPYSWSRYDTVLNTEVKPGQALQDVLQFSIERSRSLVARGKKLKTIHHIGRAVFIALCDISGHYDKAEEFLHAISIEENKPLEAKPGTGPAADLVREVYAQRARGYSDDVDYSLGRAVQAFNAYLNDEPLPLPWIRDYGYKVGKDEQVDLKKARELAPKNLGMPLPEGYPGIPSARAESETFGFTGKTATSLIEAAKSARGGEIVQIVRIDAHIARDILDRFNSGNRKPLDAQIAAISRDISGGRWMFNAQPICFASDPSVDSNARLLNGQHRLMGLIEAQKNAPEGEVLELELPIVVGIPEAAFSTYDLHARRIGAGIKKSELKVDPRVMIAAAKLLARIDHEDEIRPQLVDAALKSRKIEDSEALKLIIEPLPFSEIFQQRWTPSAAETNAIIEKYDDKQYVMPQGEEVPLLSEWVRRSRLGLNSGGLADIAPGGVIAAFAVMILDRTDPIESAERFLALIDEEKDELRQRGDPLFLTVPRTDAAGELILTRDGLIGAYTGKIGTTSVPKLDRRGLTRQLLRTYEEHLKFQRRSGPVKTNLAWPARKLEDFKLLDESRRPRLEKALEAHNDKEVPESGQMAFDDLDE